MHQSNPFTGILVIMVIAAAAWFTIETRNHATEQAKKFQSPPVVNEAELKKIELVREYVTTDSTDYTLVSKIANHLSKGEAVLVSSQQRCLLRTTRGTECYFNYEYPNNQTLTALLYREQPYLVQVTDLTTKTVRVTTDITFTFNE